MSKVIISMSAENKVFCVMHSAKYTSVPKSARTLDGVAYSIVNQDEVLNSFANLDPKSDDPMIVRQLKMITTAHIGQTVVLDKRNSVMRIS